jgi:hypothetical protein
VSEDATESEVASERSRIREIPELDAVSSLVSGEC